MFSIFIGCLNIGSLGLEVIFMGGAEEGGKGDEEIFGIFVVIDGAGNLLNLYYNIYILNN